METLKSQLAKIFRPAKLKNNGVLKLLAAISLPFFALVIFIILMWGRVYPGVKVSGISVGGLTLGSAEEKLIQESPEYKKITLATPDGRHELDTTAINLEYDYKETSQTAYSLFRTDNPLSDAKGILGSIFNGKNINYSTSYDEEALDESISIIAGQIATPPVYPSVEISGERIIINEGKSGKDVDTNNLKLKIKEAINTKKQSPTVVTVNTVDPSLTKDEIGILEKKAEALKEKQLIFTFEQIDYPLTTSEVFSLLDVTTSINDRGLDLIYKKLSNEVESKPQNAVFEFKDNKVQEFLPAKSGVEVEKNKLKEKTEEALTDLQQQGTYSVRVEIPVTKTPPSITTQDVNSLGINELLGRGTSRFRGSSAGRIHNVSLASSKFKGILVKPGEEFSFNQALGDVSTYTGYKQAYVIKDGKTVLGDGGGVCQVSTTLFRAILDAGLSITERNPHSYRVGYYEQDSKPGLDATVYSPYVDLKFTNNTPGHLLIQTEVDTSNYYLVFEIYGTSDERQVNITEPVILSSTPPPEDVYVDDPSLPEGTINQIEHKAWGARVKFDYKVTKNGNVLQEKTYYSNYQPWGAVYLRGVGPVVN